MWSPFFKSKDNNATTEEKFTAFFSGIASKVKTTIVDDIIKDVFVENNQKKDINRVILPWEELEIEDPKIAQEVKNRILDLTKSKRNFVNAPTVDSAFQFNFEKALPVALEALKADPYLEGARFYLVPKYVREKQFWRNWFYRVYIIKQAYGIKLREVEGGPTHKPNVVIPAGLDSKGDTSEIMMKEDWEREMEKELLFSSDDNLEGQPDYLSENWEEKMNLELDLEEPVVDGKKETKKESQLEEADEEVLFEQPRSNEEVSPIEQEDKQENVPSNKE